MKLLIIFIIICLFLILYYLHRNQIENFTNYNMISNGNFKDGNGFGNNTENTDFKIESIPNPGDTGYVLKQEKLGNKYKGYYINIPVKPNTSYYLSIWKSSNLAYDGILDNDIDIKSNNEDLSVQKAILEEKVIENYKWFNYIYIIHVGSYSNLDINIGSKSEFTKGHRLYSNILLRRYIKELPNFTFIKDLECLLLGNNESDGSIVKSLTGKNDIVFKNNITKGDAIDLSNNSATISSADILNNEFTIIIGYEGNINESGTLFKAPAINEVNKGVEIILHNTEGIQNTLTVIIGINKYLYNIGIAAKLMNICISYSESNNELNLYIDGSKIDHNIEYPKRVPGAEDKLLGTCPDGWRLENKDGNIKCTHSGSEPLYYTLSDSSDEKKEELATSRNLSWTNCDIIELNEIAKMNNNSCKIDKNLTFSSQAIEINSGAELTGLLRSILIYNKTFTEDEIKEINKYLVNSYNNNLSNKITDALNKSVINDNTDVSNIDCPFKDESICKQPECECIDWNNPVDVPEKCKIKVNDHCRNNFNDPKCNNLREEKCKKKKQEPKCDESQSIKDLKKELDLMKGKLNNFKSVKYINYRI